MGNRSMKRFVLSEIAKLTGQPDEGLSRDYVFGQKYATHRSHGKVLTPIPMSTLQFLFNELEPDERDRLFPGKYDLGNLTSPSQPTAAALRREIELEGLGDARNIIRTIKQQVGKLTGRDYDDYLQSDPGKTLKVTKLLYLLNTRSPVRLFSLLTPPDDAHRASMSVLDSYPVAENVDAPSLLADLKAHLSLEIPTKRRNEIDTVFGTVLDILEQIELDLRTAAYQRCGNNIDTLQQLLTRTNEALAQFRRTETTVPASLALDEKLYLHLHSLQYLHFVAEQRFILGELAPNTSIQAIGQQLSALSGQMQGKPRGGFNDECIPIDDLSATINQHATATLGALSDGLGFEVKPKDLEKALPLTIKLLRMWALFRYGVPALLHGFHLSPLRAVAALASVCNQFRHPTKYYPYWLGQPHGRGNVISALEKINADSAQSTVPEEYLHFWKHQLQWFVHALAGQLPSYKAQLALGRELHSAFEPVVKLHDTKLLRQRLAEYRQLSAMRHVIPQPV